MASYRSCDQVVRSKNTKFRKFLASKIKVKNSGNLAGMVQHMLLCQRARVCRKLWCYRFNQYNKTAKFNSFLLQNESQGQRLCEVREDYPLSSCQSCQNRRFCVQPFLSSCKNLTYQQFDLENEGQRISMIWQKFEGHHLQLLYKMMTIMRSVVMAQLKIVKFRKFTFKIKVMGIANLTDVLTTCYFPLQT